MLIGYARVSTDDQYLELQCDALAAAGCERVFEDTASGAKAERTGLMALFATLRGGDTVVIWWLDRLGRSLKDLIYLIERLDAAGAGLHSLQESIDTTSNGGRKKRLDPEHERLAPQLYLERRHAVAEICRLMRIGKSTRYNYLSEAERNAQRAA